MRSILRTRQTAPVAGANRVIETFRALQAASGFFGAARGFTDDGRAIAAVVTTTDNMTALIKIPVP